MREFQEKRRRIKNSIWPKVSMVVLFFFLILVIHGVMNVYAKDQESKEELALATKQQAELQRQDDEFKNESAYLNTSEGVEAEIRNKFDVAKSGEGVIVIVDQASTTVPTDNRSFVTKLWDSIRSVFGNSTSTVINKDIQ